MIYTFRTIQILLLVLYKIQGKSQNPLIRKNLLKKLVSSISLFSKFVNEGGGSQIPSKFCQCINILWMLPVLISNRTFLSINGMSKTNELHYVTRKIFMIFSMTFFLEISVIKQVIHMKYLIPYLIK